MTFWRVKKVFVKRRYDALLHYRRHPREPLHVSFVVNVEGGISRRAAAFLSTDEVLPSSVFSKPYLFNAELRRTHRTQNDENYFVPTINESDIYIYSHLLNHCAYALLFSNRKRESHFRIVIPFEWTMFSSNTFVAIKLTYTIHKKRKRKKRTPLFANE